MQDRIRHELVKLHAINEKKPMKKFVGRKRKTAEEESKEHNLITARGLGDALSARKTIGGATARNPSLLALFRSDSSNSEGTHLVAVLPLFFFVIFSLCATIFVGIWRRCARGCEETEERKEDEAMAVAEEQRAGKTVKPRSPLIKLPVK
jgi:hypothetical protein